MIDLDHDIERNIISIAFNDDLTENDFEHLRDKFNQAVNATDTAPNLIIRAEEFPEWDDFDAFKAHMNFVHEHHQHFERVAMVTNSNAIGLMRPFVDLITKAQIRRFRQNELDAATTWVTSGEEPSHTAAITLLEGFPRNVIAIELNGKVQSSDYDEILTPLVNEKMTEHDKIKLLAIIGENFDGYSLGAAWDDVTLGLRHWGDFSSIAIVTNHDWMEKAVRFFGALLPADIMVFENDEIETAKKWIWAAA